MEDNNHLPSIPSNYVTLSELKQRWLKDKQQLKGKEKERNDIPNQRLRHPQNEDDRPNIEAPRPKQRYENRGSDNRRYGERNRNFKGIVSGASRKEGFVRAVAVVEGNEGKSTGNEMKSKDLVREMMNMRREEEQKKKKRMKRSKKRQEDKEKMVKDGENRTQGEEEVVEREVHAPRAKSDKESIPVRRYERKRDMTLDFGPKNANLVEKSDCTVEMRGEVKHVIVKSDFEVEMLGEVKDVMGKSDFAVEMEGEVKDVMKKSEGTIEIERKFGDLCMEGRSDGAEIQNSTIDGRESEYRSHTRIVDNRYIKRRGFSRTVRHCNSQYRSYNGVFNRQNNEYGVYNGGGYQHKGHFRRNYQGFNSVWRKEKDSGNERVWVKKGEVVDTHDA